MSKTISNQALGLLGWNASTHEEFIVEVARLTGKGAVLINVDREADRPVVHFEFCVPREKAAEILGYEPDEEEWLEQDAMLGDQALLLRLEPEHADVGTILVEQPSYSEFIDAVTLATTQGAFITDVAINNGLGSMRPVQCGLRMFKADAPKILGFTQQIRIG